MFKRVFLIVMDSFGCGEMPDAEKFGDKGSNTLKSCLSSKEFYAPNLTKLGLQNIDGINCGEKVESTIGSYGKLEEASNGKDTTTGHWEMAGLVSTTPMHTFPDGFPDEIMDKITAAWGRGYLCNKPYSGTELLLDYGREHLETGKLMVYTSADSVFQIAAHEELVPLADLYKYCEQARELLTGDYQVGRVIARPFVGEYPNYVRTSNRHDYSVSPPAPTMLNLLQDAGLKVISVGKIEDIFAGYGVDEGHRIADNNEGMEVSKSLLNEDFEGLCFINLVDFDAKYGHRNNIDGYATAVTEFDVKLGEFMAGLRDDDLLIVTADHGCDPATPSTDHSREYVPVLCYGKSVKQNNNLGTKFCFGSIGKTILENFNVESKHLEGTSFLSEIVE